MGTNTAWIKPLEAPVAATIKITVIAIGVMTNQWVERNSFSSSVSPSRNQTKARLFLTIL